MRRVLLTALCLAFGACALLSKGEVPLRRYFSPELTAAGPTPGPRSALELRLGRVTAGASLAQRMVVRDSAQELAFSDDRLWTERPETYLRRGLARALFEERGLRSVLRGVAPTLDVELIAFEEVGGPPHVARVTVAFCLSDERVVSLQQTLTVDRPVAGGDAAAVAQATGEALSALIAELAGRVVAELERPRGADGGDLRVSGRRP